MTSLPTKDDRDETVSDLMWMSLDVELLELAHTLRTDPERAERVLVAYEQQTGTTPKNKERRHGIRA